MLSRSVLFPKLSVAGETYEMCRMEARAELGSGPQRRYVDPCLLQQPAARNPRCGPRLLYGQSQFAERLPKDVEPRKSSINYVTSALPNPFCSALTPQELITSSPSIQQETTIQAKQKMVEYIYIKGAF